MGFFQKIKGFLVSDKNPPLTRRDEQGFVTMSNGSAAGEERVFSQNRFYIEEGILKLEEGKCPYCGYELENPPSRKRNCPSCKNDMYVRTLPYVDEAKKVRVLVTEEKAEKIDIAWAKIAGTYEELIKDKKRFEEMKQQLFNAWGTVPSDSDVNWHLMMNNRIEHYNNQQWGLYRNTTLRMAEHL
ncbi:hypothetical protein AADC60_10570 [Cytobacillus pseudoceanisediminis]|uniref:Uncharacterized protein n=1 Tax=Cytobacillus pseudoceanisediminis TaxID=3051614 RepID=A0ABZ2ZP76_9BACI